MIHKFLHIWQKLVEFGNVLIRVSGAPSSFSRRQTTPLAGIASPLLFTFYLLPFSFYPLFIYECN